MKETKPDAKSNPFRDFMGWISENAKRIPPNMPTWMRWLALSTAAALVLAELVFGWGFPAPELNTPTVTAEKQTRRLIVTGEGVVEPYERGLITARAAGRVKTVFHAVGDTVREGDLIALLESEDAQRALDQTAIALDEAKAAVAPALSAAAPAVIVSPVSGRIIALRGEPGDSITGGACARIAVGGALSVTLPDTALAVAVGETVSVEATVLSGTIEVSGVVIERELGSATVRITDERLTERQVVSVYDPDGNPAGSGALEIDEAALVWGVSGVIRYAHAMVGDWIDEGEPIFTLEGPLTLPGYETQMQTLEAAASEAAQAKRTAEGLSVYAPADGVLTGMTLTAGTVVREGEAIGMLIDANSRMVEFNVSAEGVGALQVGQETKIVAGGMEYVGWVVSVEYPTAIIATDIRAPLGAAASAAVDTGIEREGIWAPESAVTIRANGSAYAMRAPDAARLPYAWLRGPIGRLLRPSDEAIIESLTPELQTSITIGGKADGMVEIKSGIRENEALLDAIN
ncbi:MAG: HlyD family efflux transporter periplasmic adaptor subunit [Oscillospiraceae bacterium]|jgi:multidrug efflux pump subunit AcrA (membrane-fusion protein)|nr:HlyD family efflux transporter periplasmic adaptor subunit [Oscillospiraceae bacterium]